ncbi:MAG TPA: hypothetical protein PKK06_05070 [Phycisphaerae bacterium]|nr:hypothetical protein [Phycisphaerae bacterium]
MRKETNWHSKWYGDVWKVMSKILDEESFDKTASDPELAQAVKAAGVFCDETVARDVRIEHGIGNKDERRVANYARDFKRGRIQK